MFFDKKSANSVLTEINLFEANIKSVLNCLNITFSYSFKCIFCYMESYNYYMY